MAQPQGALLPEAFDDEPIDALYSLEERIKRAVELVTQLRSQNEALSIDLAAAMAERDTARKEASQLEELRSERKQVRTRIEKLLGQMDLLSGA